MQRSRRQINRAIYGALIAGFVLLTAATVAVAALIGRVQEQSDLVSHTYQVEAALADLQLRIERAEVGRRGFLIAGTEFFAEVVERNIADIAGQVDRLRALVADNPPQLARLDAIVARWSEHVPLLRSSMAERRAVGPGGAAASIFDESDIAKVREVRRIGTEMVTAERELLTARSGELRGSTALLYAVMTAAGLLLAAVALVTIVATRRNLDALATTGERLRELNEDLEAAVSERTKELKQANDEIQRFAYIVSHDLRSPLVNVMGFTAELDAATRPLSEMIRRAETEAPDLVTEDARVAVEEDLPEAIGFIRSSTQKMDRLINAILRLSREGRRVLVPEPLDMNALVGGIVDSLQHRLSEIGAEITVGKLPGARSDRVAMEQIFSNLIENSTKYLKPGRPGRVAVSGQRRADRVVFEVADNGRGIDPKDHQRIFDLFRRSGTQDQPGEGIGLAHVRALAYRLGGVVECESVLGEGATFRVSLPTSLRPEVAS